LEEAEISNAIKMIKLKKAEIDGIRMEAWKFAGVELRKELVKLLRMIWKKGTIPAEWKSSSSSAFV